MVAPAGRAGSSYLALYSCLLRRLHLPAPQTLVFLSCRADLASSITVTGIKIWYTKTRANHIPNPYGETTDADGHWGLVYCEQGRAGQLSRLAAPLSYEQGMTAWRDTKT